MRVTEIRRESDFEKLRSQWDALLRDSRANTIFLSWDWVAAWWSNYGGKGQLRIFAAFDSNGALRGIAPLRCRKARKYGQTVHALSFLGDGSNDSEYLDFIIAEGLEREVLHAFCSYLAPVLDRGTVLLLHELPDTSPTLHWLRAEADRSGFEYRETSTPCSILPLLMTWDEYLSTLRPRFRTKVRSVLRHLEGRPEVRFGFCSTPEEVRRTLPALFDLHTRRWAQEGKPGVFGWQAKREFYLDISLRLLERGRLRCSWLEWNGTILACQYGFAYEGTYFHLQEGYEPSSEHWNLGIGLRAWSIRHFLQEGLGQYDFLGGVKRNKTDWGAGVKQSKNILLASVTAANYLYCHGPVWEANARTLAKTFIPQKLIGAVQPYFEPRNRALIQDGEPARLRVVQSLRRAVAVTYFRFGMAAMARVLRARYHVCVSNHKRTHIAFARKTNPSARILYYHRVNDEHDPFFPAISTRLFEQEMRFLAHHYKVVSLASLLKHLSDGKAEDVIAITFDDGYRDNFENAFPVLQRYNLPATIFLSTGSIDSGEPLWFELLAQAIKATSEEFLDLEIDIPRRFWMRTTAERLQANERVFALLRNLDDSTRQEWLERIIIRLEPTAGNARRNRMLAWDQIRAMNAAGIDFGGHTITHPFLSRLNHEQAEWEISECKRRIESQLQHQVDHFAYPNGREEDFNECNKDILLRAGYKAAVTTIWGMNYASTDPMELRRGQPWEEDAALFACKFDWYQLMRA